MTKRWVQSGPIVILSLGEKSLINLRWDTAHHHRKPRRHHWFHPVPPRSTSGHRRHQRPQCTKAQNGPLSWAGAVRKRKMSGLSDLCLRCRDQRCVVQNQRGAASVLCDQAGRAKLRRIHLLPPRRPQSRRQRVPMESLGTVGWRKAPHYLYLGGATLGVILTVSGSLAHSGAGSR